MEGSDTFRRWLPRVLALVCACMLLATQACPDKAFGLQDGMIGSQGEAQQALSDQASTGSIEIEAKVGDDVLAGDSYSIACVAEASVSRIFGNTVAVTYSTVPAFGQFDRQWGDVTAGDIRKIACEMVQFVGENGLFDETVVTDSNGQAVFDGLQPGIYLLARTAFLPGNSGYESFPSLISVPCEVDGTLLMDVTVDPKFEIVRQPYPIPSDSDSAGDSAGLASSGTLGKTGDGVFSYAAAVLAVLLAALAGALFASYANGRRAAACDSGASCAAVCNFGGCSGGAERFAVNDGGDCSAQGEVVGEKRDQSGCTRKEAL